MNRRALVSGLAALGVLALSGCGGNETFSHAVVSGTPVAAADFGVRLLNVPVNLVTASRAALQVNSAQNPCNANGGFGIQVEVTSQNGFAGDVQVTLGPSPGGFTIGSPQPNPIHLSSGGMGTSTFPISSVTSIGDSQLVTVTSGAVSHSVTAFYTGGLAGD